MNGYPIFLGGGKMRKRCGINKGILAIAFALGIALACICPSEFLVAVLAVAVIVLGISCLKY